MSFDQDLWAVLGVAPVAPAPFATGRWAHGRDPKRLGCGRPDHTDGNRYYGLGWLADGKYQPFAVHAPTGSVDFGYVHGRCADRSADYVKITCQYCDATIWERTP